MQQSAKKFLSACLFAAVLTNVSSANNNLFLPGDAFFHTSLTLAQSTELRTASEKPPVFEYSFHGAAFHGAFCGYAGYGRVTIADDDGKFAANLADAYDWARFYSRREWRETGVPGELIEINPVHVFFYPAAFDINQHRVGLRYNERWIDEVLKFGHHRQHVRLCCFLDGKDAIEQSWRDAAVVPELDVQIPEAKIKPSEKITEPVVISGKFKAIVLPDDLSGCLEPEDYSKIYVVDAAGGRELRFDSEHGKWLPTDEE